MRSPYTSERGHEAPHQFQGADKTLTLEYEDTRMKWTKERTKARQDQTKTSKNTHSPAVGGAPSIRMGKQAVLKIQHPIMPGLGDRSNPSPPMDRPRGKAAHQACPFPPPPLVYQWQSGSDMTPSSVELERRPWEQHLPPVDGTEAGPPAQGASLLPQGAG